MRMIKGLVIGLAAVLGTTIITACGSSSAEDDAQNRTVVVDQSVKLDNRKTVEVDGVTASFYYSTAPASGPMGTSRPVVHVELDPVTPGGVKNFRAKVQVRQDGNAVDTYYPFGDKGSSKNERIANDFEYNLSFGLLPKASGPRHDGSSDDLASKTGKDFEFTIADIEIADSPFTPTELVRRALPTFADTPEDQFNKLAYDRRWPVSKMFSPSTTSGSTTDPVRLPATAMISFVRQVNERADSKTAPTSPTQLFEDWMKSWNADMLAKGIEMFGDDKIKETYRWVLDGDIERWFPSSTYIVGSGPGQIPPGTYQTTAPDRLFKDGYWERTSVSGDIIDNNFVSSAQQVTVTIGANDGQFTASRLGTWKPVG
ncbi:hypothetical protein [Rhodococcus sp. 1139]|uniref:hypothetical protein n=1 Tax=Rhodococcus sp. 1139 TaxID=1833762 RepID=UPI0008720208|nr:hypothetical protein [Rhodococcus sp. 1139]OFE08348.1 hypothetical protein A5N83_12850 [Rhodococcus sp. 1139]